MNVFISFYKFIGVYVLLNQLALSLVHIFSDILGVLFVSFFNSRLNFVLVHESLIFFMHSNLLCIGYNIYID